LYTAHLSKKSQGAESQQNDKNVLRSRLNSLGRVSRCGSSTARLFHSRGPTTVKLLSPSHVYLSPRCVMITGMSIADVTFMAVEHLALLHS